MCRIASLFFLLQRLKESMPGDARDFNNMETRAVIKFYFFPAKQGAEGNSRHSDTNIKGNILLTQYRAGDKIKKNEMGWACGAYG